ncbi:glutathione synthase [Candidatus Pandoraea novymonadis]|uniref:Glutathione synthetase n=1 Tax=Candidatus Pandoraea novymonadis TaxID=1808959 RepID=A0ABX5FDH6_9BURK|nr:glutathione synthase [Candidatus Pandoraea novymonadis]PSB91739.1 Glutathione synthetase [Candidatus Pandoraea novymonadis]
MKILFIADPLEHLKIYKDTTFSMMSEAARRGYSVFFCQDHSLVWQCGNVEAKVVKIHLTGDKAYWYSIVETSVLPLTDFDVVLVRKDPPFDMEYVNLTWLLEIAERAGARIFNRPQAIRDHSEKLAISEFSSFIPPTLVTRDASCLRAFHAQHGDIIFKPLDGMGGAGIFRITEDGRNLGTVIEILGENGFRSVMVQKFIPEIKQGDKRILLIGGQVVPFTLARIPQGTEVRANLAAGGLGKAQTITERDREIAETIGPVLWTRGLLLVGLDTIGGYLTEVNVTSPTCFQEIFDQTGFDVTKMFIDELENAI